MADVLVKAGTLVLIVALGYLARRLGWVKASDFATLSTIALRITLPCALVTSFQEREFVTGLLWVTVVGLGVILIGQLVAWTVARPRGRPTQALAIFHTPSCNIGLFAIPYLSAFVGPPAILVAAMFDIGNSLAAGGPGYAWGTVLARSDQKILVGVIVRRIFASPVFLTYLFVLFLGLTGIQLPGPVLAFTGTVGAANTFVAMFLIGVGLQLGVGGAVYRAAAKYLGLRYAYMTAAGLVVWFLLPLGELEKVTVTLILCSPIPVMASLFTQEAGLDVRLSTLLTSVTVLIGIVLMPTMLLVLT